jgi:hypothetical protein
MKHILFTICLAVSVFSLAVGYGLAGGWIGLGLAILSGLIWLLARKYSAAAWLPYVGLFGSVGLAAAGVTGGASPWLMIGAACGALATWDLLLWEHARQGSAPGEETGGYEQKHLQALALALGSGLGVALLGSLLHLQIPFAVVVVVAAMVMVGLERVWRWVKS